MARRQAVTRREHAAEKLVVELSLDKEMLKPDRRSDANWLAAERRGQ
jgi:hypothetical protein